MNGSVRPGQLVFLGQYFGIIVGSSVLSSTNDPTWWVFWNDGELARHSGSWLQGYLVT